MRNRATQAGKGAGHTALALALVLATFIALLAGCASSPAGSSKREPLARFQTVAIVNKGLTEELNARFLRAGRGDLTAEDKAKYAVMGLADAAIWCGPFILVCATGMAVALTVGELTADTLAAGAESLEPEQLEQLESIMVAANERRILHQELRDAVAARVPATHLATPDEARDRVELRLADVRFGAAEDGQYALRLDAELRARWPRKRGDKSIESRDYSFQGHSWPMEHWLADEGENFNRGLDECIDGLAQAIHADFQYLSLSYPAR